MAADATAELSPLRSLLRCLMCGAEVELDEIVADPGYPELGPDGWLSCSCCAERYPVIAGTARMLPKELRGELAAAYPRAGITLGSGPTTGRSDRATVQQRTARSFAYEWQHFGRDRPEWRRNFLDYMRPIDPAGIAEALVLDVGAGSGRHSRQAADLGANVVAVDVGPAIDVARTNLPWTALTVQADAERLPFAPGSFDLVLSIGVLHHLPDTEHALHGLVRYAAPGGRVHVYLYWLPERRLHRSVLKLVSAIRLLTVRLPHRMLHGLCYPLSVLLWIGIVQPYRLMRRLPGVSVLADAFPLKAYADYPFGVLVNDQFDRFSAPIEHRYTRSEVSEMLERAGLVEVVVVPNNGWIGDGRLPHARR